MRLGNSVVHALGNKYNQIVCLKEYKDQKRRINERPIEYRFVFQQLTDIMPATVLDVGTGTSALPHLMHNCGFVVTAIDNIKDYWPNGMINRHFYIIHDNILNTKLTKKFELITCVSVLEHIKDHQMAIRSLFSLLRPRGYLLLTFPYNEKNYVDNVYSLPQASYGKDLPYICQVYSRNEVNNWMLSNDAKIVVQEYWKIFSGDYWTFGERIVPPRQVTINEKHHLTCILMQSKGI